MDTLNLNENKKIRDKKISNAYNIQNDGLLDLLKILEIRRKFGQFNLQKVLRFQFCFNFILAKIILDSDKVFDFIEKI